MLPLLMWLHWLAMLHDPRPPGEREHRSAVGRRVIDWTPREGWDL